MAEPGPQAPVDHGVAGADHEAAEERGGDRVLQADRRAGPALERPPDPLEHVVADVGIGSVAQCPQLFDNDPPFGPPWLARQSRNTIGSLGMDNPSAFPHTLTGL